MNRHPVNTLEHFISALEKKDPNWPIRGSCGQYYTRCPAHEGPDDDSMSFTLGDEGQLLVTCHSQDCEYEQIMASVGLSPGDGFARPNPRRSVGAHPKAKRALRGSRSSMGKAKRTGRHASPTKKGRSVASQERVTYNYRDEDGNLDRQVVKTIELNTAGEKVGKKVAQRRPVEGGFAYTTKGGWFESKDGRKYQRVADPEDPRPSKDAVLVSDPVRHLLYRLPEVNEALTAGDTIFVVEGEADVETLQTLGFCATTNAGGAGKWRKEHTEQLAGANQVIIIPDNDDPGRKHADQVGKSLADAGIDVRLLELPDLEEKGDVTDWVEVGGTKDDLDDLIENASPWSPIAEQDLEGEDTFEILDSPPSTLTRPLSIDGDTGYLYARALGTIGGQTTSADVVVDSNGGVFSRPRLRDSRALEDLDFEIEISDDISPQDFISPGGLKRLIAGETVSPYDVFVRIVDSVNKFIDFNRSVGSGSTLARLIALIVMQTYFLGAFRRIGYVWIAGDYGSGKSKLLKFIARLGYLGQFLVSSSTYAAIRDVAQAGASLCIDDIGRLNDTDKNLRSLFLSGNTRGSEVVLKVRDSGRKWVNRRVDAFGFKMFSSTEVPDQILASRSIMLPMVPSANAAITVSDPEDADDWPHDLRTLLDDLWIMGLQYLPAAHRAYKEACSDILRGRVFDPWRPVLSVASLLESIEPKNCQGLFDEIHELAVEYQEERKELERDHSREILVRAIWKICFEFYRSTGSSAPFGGETDLDTPLPLIPGDIAKIATRIAITEGAHGPNSGKPYIWPQQVGDQMAKWRFLKAGRTNSSRRRSVTPRAVLDLADAFAIELPGDPRPGIPVSTCQQCQPPGADEDDDQAVSATPVAPPMGTPDDDQSKLTSDSRTPGSNKKVDTDVTDDTLSPRRNRSWRSQYDKVSMFTKSRRSARRYASRVKSPGPSGIER